jgi:hypothetical protein
LSACLFTQAALSITERKLYYDQTNQLVFPPTKLSDLH